MKKSAKIKIEVKITWDEALKAIETMVVDKHPLLPNAHEIQRLEDVVKRLKIAKAVNDVVTERKGGIIINKPYSGPEFP